MDNFVITLPKGCACRTTEIGDHSNQIELVTPGHMVALGSVGCLAIRSTTCIDRCIADLVQAFWAAGLVTTGCCCGHNQQEGYIGLLRPIDSTVNSG